jgi:hypothetical protein
MTLKGLMAADLKYGSEVVSTVLVRTDEVTEPVAPLWP